MRAVRLLLAGAALAGSFAITAPVQAASWHREVEFALVGYASVVVRVGCYEYGGRSHYFVDASVSSPPVGFLHRTPVPVPACVGPS